LRRFRRRRCEEGVRRRHRFGNFSHRTNAAGQVTTILSYDGAGRVLSMTDVNNIETDLSYNARGWLTQKAVRATNGTTGSGDQITSLTYDNVGNVTQITQPNGAYTGFVYDAANRLTDITDNLGDDIHYTLDVAGDRTEDDTKDPSGNLSLRCRCEFVGIPQGPRVFPVPRRSGKSGRTEHRASRGQPDVVAHAASAQSAPRHGVAALQRLGASLDTVLQGDPSLSEPTLRVLTQRRNRMRQLRTSGSVRGAPGDRRPYRDLFPICARDGQSHRAFHSCGNVLRGEEANVRPRAILPCGRRELSGVSARWRAPRPGPRP